MFNFKYDLDKPFQVVLYRIDNWVNEGSSLVIEIGAVKYVNIFVYSPLSKSTSIKLPNKLKSLMKGLINIKKWQ